MTRYDELSDDARNLMAGFDELDIAEIAATAQQRATSIGNQLVKAEAERDGAYRQRAQLLARLARIAGAHAKNQTAGGMTSGDCDECGEPWPCPTNVWATTDRTPDATWDPADDEPAPPGPDTLPCSLANLGHPHLSHSWRPQPGMRPILCNGVPAVPEETGR